MVMDAGPMVKLVLLTLLIFSVISWAIIIYKLLLLRKVEKETTAFYDIFWQKRQFKELSATARNYRNTPLSNLFTAVYTELSSAVKASEGAGGAGGAGEAVHIDREDLDRIERVLKKTGSVETTKLEYAVPFLATTGNTAPFIGLFGTVWGIMTSFQAIGARGAANLAVVAPGISEALVATAMGLLVAIPAVVGYNHLLSRIDRITSEMANFSSDLVNIIEKRLTRRTGQHT
jgi:biopolymer transport protein TolQ